MKKRPFMWLFIAAPVILAVWLMMPQTRQPGVALFGLPVRQAIWLFPLVLVVLGLVQLATRHRLGSGAAFRLHSVLTLITVLLITILALLGIAPSEAVSARHEWVGNGMQVLTLLFMLTQIAFLSRLGWGMFRGKGAERNSPVG